MFVKSILTNSNMTLYCQYKIYIIQLLKKKWNITKMKFRAKELKDFLLLKKYSKNTQEVIKLIFLDHERQIDVAAKLEMKPQRIHNIKKQFLEDFLEMKDNNYIKFEGYISAEYLNDLIKFKEKCKSFKTSLLPSQK